MENKEFLNRILSDKRATRREFLVNATAMGLALSTASGMWNHAQAATPKRGGHLRAGLSDASTDDTLDSRKYNGTTMISISRACRDSLVELGQDNTAKPALAESWESSPDAKVWRFNLRKGVEFSNGKSLTPEDVINSINLHRGEDSTSAAAGVFAGISDVQADGNNVVEVTLSEGNAQFPYLMTDYHMNIVPTKDGVADVLSVHGTGTYLLKDFKPGVRASFERNPNAWQSDFGFVDSCELTAVLDETARQSALLSGSMDVISAPSPKTIGRLAEMPNINVRGTPSNSAYTNPMHVDKAPFDNNDFRLALKHAFPREEFVEKILFGYGVVGNDQPLGPLFNSYDPELKIKYDLDRARAHIKAAGMENAKIDIHTSDTAYDGAIDAAVLFRESLAKIGVELNIVRVPRDGYWSEIWQAKPFCLVSWGGRPVEDMILSLAYTSEASWNDTNISIDRVDELVKAARSELDDAKRNDMYGEVQRLISQQGGSLVPAFGTDLVVTSSIVGIGPDIGGGWFMDGGFFIKRWWLES
ncbi:Periplasmic dipeptide transport protein precursor [Roseovarius albus]|uniref:Periplasmic dipeptide transport protein n=1 Tax=Roseovarius albus TaxID=1247867 RepID=A0A1X6ZM53_9RHOB|nr:ABC transporter substrate-binding protein [Roseovarius albus]SLN53408.1 Periplasmic dipeptide transport protein precursor [Roseovarius albus]